MYAVRSIPPVVFSQSKQCETVRVIEYVNFQSRFLDFAIHRLTIFGDLYHMLELREVSILARAYCSTNAKSGTLNERFAT
jgi:hypothetical protein